jgi:hypothetical protein
MHCSMVLGLLMMLVFPSTDLEEASLGLKALLD